MNINEIQKMEKVELHCHLDGILNKTILEKLRKQDSDLPHDLLETIQPVQSLSEFMDWFGITMPFFNKSWDRLLFVLKEHIQNLIQNHVIYAEIMVPKSELPQDKTELINKFSQFRALRFNATGSPSHSAPSVWE